MDMKFMNLGFIFVLENRESSFKNWLDNFNIKVNKNQSLVQGLGVAQW